MPMPPDHAVLSAEVAKRACDKAPTFLVGDVHSQVLRPNEKVTVPQRGQRAIWRCFPQWSLFALRRGCLCLV